MPELTLKMLGEVADEVSAENDALIAAFKTAFDPMEASSVGDGEVLGAMKAGGLLMVAKIQQKLLARMKP